MKKFKLPILLKLITPFSTIFSLTFIFVAYTFNQHYDAGIDLGIVPEIAYVIEDAAKESAEKLSSAISSAKGNLDLYKAELISKYDSSQEENNPENPSYPDNVKNIYDFSINTQFRNFSYLSQHDPQWNSVGLGPGDSIDTYGCGPTTLAMIVSNFSDSEFTPDKASKLMFEKKLYIPGVGSIHSIIPKGLADFGIKSYSFNNYSQETINIELQKGNIFVALMKNGVFSSSTGHFIILLGLDADGKIIIADSNSVANSKKTWDLPLILSEAKYNAGGTGPFWLVESSVAN
ncbi:MAG: C39 family peptidase [Proteocatella sp.]